ncbi:MAG: PA0069 family radical SAM protein [Calditrichia bacterium]
MSEQNPQKKRGRAAISNPAGRFEKLEYFPDFSDLEEDDDEFSSDVKTIFYRDTSKSIISFNQSPDVPFDAGINPYRGCEHGCIYCFARPSHEFLGLSAGLDFETKIFVKHNAATLLRKELNAKKWQPKPIAISGSTDPYQPAEKHFRITRSVLEVLAEFRNPVGIVTKNHLITRDIDLLKELATHNAIRVVVSVTTLDGALARKMEPRTSQPTRRIEAIRKLAEAGIPVGVFTAPVIPGLTDHEIPAIIKTAADAGASFAGYVMLRLPYSVSGLFEQWLESNFPERKEKVMNRVRDIRGGNVNDSRFFERMKGDGAFAEQVKTLFQAACRNAGIPEGRSDHSRLSTKSFRRPGDAQMNLF